MPSAQKAFAIIIRYPGNRLLNILNAMLRQVEDKLKCGKPNG